MPCYALVLRLWAILFIIHNSDKTHHQPQVSFKCLCLPWSLLQPTVLHYSSPLGKCPE